jgi:hypothetical protein
MHKWVAAEMVAGQRHDTRHGKRLAQRLARLGEQSVRRIPRACHGWADTVAAYRFLDNPAIEMQAIVSGHKHATLARSHTQDVVLLGQDTTFLAYGTTQPKAGRGTVQGKKRQEYLRPPTVAFTPERVNFGVRGAKYNRRLANSQAQRSLWTDMREAPPLGRLTFVLARPPERPPRQRTVTVTAKQVTFQQARRPEGPLPPVEGAAI